MLQWRVCSLERCSLGCVSHKADGCLPLCVWRLYGSVSNETRPGGTQLDTMLLLATAILLVVYQGCAVLRRWCLQLIEILKDIFSYRAYIRSLVSFELLKHLMPFTLWTLVGEYTLYYSISSGKNYRLVRSLRCKLKVGIEPDLIESVVSNSSSIVACIFIVVGTCLPNRCLVMVISSGSSISAFRPHVTVLPR